jgi:hypothetical protein
MQNRELLGVLRGLKVREATRFLRSLMHDAVKPWEVKHTAIEGLYDILPGEADARGHMSELSRVAAENPGLKGITLAAAEHESLKQYEQTGEKSLPIMRGQILEIERYSAQHLKPSSDMITQCLVDLYDRLLYKDGMTFAEMEAPAERLIEDIRQHDHGPGPARVVAKMLQGVLDRCRLAERERGN